ncbi:uncharacterized protein TNCV_380071 [Trichonephila clavipes]|nr:uncharacterized protein TNCV_380071 [Trichonephila clavipes]
MSEADDLISKIQELQGIIEQQNQRLQQLSSITNESNWIEQPQVYRVSPKLPPFWAGMYEKLKNQLINCLSLSEEQRVRKLLGHEELGDCKPSQFLRHLRSLAGAIEIKPTLLCSLLLQCLPLHVQAILQGQSTLKPDQMADRIMEVPLLTSMPSVSSIDPTVTSASPRVLVTLEPLAEKVEDLAK